MLACDPPHHMIRMSAMSWSDVGCGKLPLQSILFPLLDCRPFQSMFLADSVKLVNRTKYCKCGNILEGEYIGTGSCNGLGKPLQREGTLQ